VSESEPMMKEEAMGETQEGRTSCKFEEIPKWVRKFGKAISIEASGRTWEATQHIGICIDAPRYAINEAASKQVDAQAWVSDELPAAEVGRAYAIDGSTESDYKSLHVVCDVGAVRVGLKFVLLVERLFPGCTWRAPMCAKDAPVQAIVNGVVVAFVAGQMPGGGSIGGTA
jgi:hypothetical protein